MASAAAGASELIPKDQSKIPDLPISAVSKILTDEECPNVSIIIPCYKRRKFISLMLMNIAYMDYPKNKIEVCILQDGPEDLMNEQQREIFKKESGCRLVYRYEPNVRRSIGEKRNYLVKKMATSKFIACMDSDDIYFPTYLRYSISALKEHKVGITSSASMLFVYPHYDYKLTGIRCGYKHQGHEACAVFTKRHFGQMSGFVSKGKNANAGEGVKMIAYNEKNMVNLDISKLMVCVCHNGEDGNTINKERFKQADMDCELYRLPHLDCLKMLLGDSGQVKDCSDNVSSEDQ